MDSFNLSILKIEGLQDLSNSYLYLYLDQTIDRVITLEYFESATMPVTKNLIKILIEDSQSSAFQVSVSLKSEIIKRPGYYWLPLLKSDDLITQIPEEVNLPRILINIEPHALSPVLELTEISSVSEHDFKLPFTETYDTEDLVLNHSLEKLAKSKEEDFLEYQEVIKEKDRLIEELENEIILKEKQILKVSKENKELIGIVDELYEEYNKLIKQLGEKENENSDLKPRINNYLLSVNPESSFQVFSKNYESFAKSYYDSNPNKSQLKQLEEIEIKARNFLRSKNIEKFSSILPEVSYKIFNKKVSLIMKNGLLYCKSDGLLKKFEFFINNHCLIDIKKTKKRYPSQIKADISAPSHNRRVSAVSLKKSLSPKRFPESR